MPKKEGLSLNWYYVQNGKRMGPVSDEELQTLVSTGVIASDGLVWRKGMANWQRYGDALNESETGGGVQTQQATHERTFRCVECGNMFPPDEMVQYGESKICATCKPVFFQRLKEGSRLPATLCYAGFWIRFAAKLVDWIIVGVADTIVRYGLGFFMVIPDVSQPSNMRGFFAMSIISTLVQLAIAVSYSTFFVGKYAATPGKMVCSLKIVTPEGGKVSYSRAFGRYFAEILSGMIFAIGYIMAAFDDEKRALHDRICSTRVIRK
jgi:uncharacterized RDD family membrane protein YckC